MPFLPAQQTALPLRGCPLLTLLAFSRRPLLLHSPAQRRLRLAVMLKVVLRIGNQHHAAAQLLAGRMQRYASQQQQHHDHAERTVAPLVHRLMPSITRTSVTCR